MKIVGGKFLPEVSRLSDKESPKSVVLVDGFCIPISSMYGIFPHIYHKNQPNVGKYTRHGWYGIDLLIISS